MSAVVLSMLCKVARKLPSVPAMLLRRDTSKGAELLVLRHENAVLRRPIAGPVRYEPADRFWLAALSSLIPPAPLARGLRGHSRYPAGLAPQVHRREVGLQRPTRPHRTPAHQGSAQKADPAARSREREVGTQADPGRTGPTRAPHRSIIAVDFFHLDSALGRRLYALAFLEHGARRLHIAGVTANPTREWTVQQARNLAADLGTRMKSLYFLLRDRDGKYGQSFDAVFEAEETVILKSAPRAPRMNATASG
ncbi:hypothetical protein ACWEWG_28345 [Streptomyces sp. NPDC003758]